MPRRFSLRGQVPAPIEILRSAVFAVDCLNSYGQSPPLPVFLRHARHTWPIFSADETNRLLPAATVLLERDSYLTRRDDHGLDQD